MKARDDGTEAALDIEVRNFRSGQLIEMTVIGDWSVGAVEARLERIIAVRQPSEIRLHLPISDASSELPAFAEARERLADIGGTLLVEAAATAPGGATTPSP